MDIGKGLELWRLLEKLTIPQAALLIAGLNPGKCRFVNKIEPEKSDIYEGQFLLSLESTAHFRAAYHAIILAGKDDRLKIEWDEDFMEGIVEATSYVLVEDLKKWLLSRGLRPAFFFPEDDSRDAKDKKYMFQDPNHPHYTPKLAAAVAAWEAVNEAEGGKTVKATLAEWLRQNADQYDLHNKKTGELKEDVIEQISSVANWQTKGGAPKTPAN